MPKFVDDGDDADDPLLAPGAGAGAGPPTTEDLLAFLRGGSVPAAPPGVSLARQAAEVWSALIAGPDPAARVALDARRREFRAALGPADSLLERVLCDQADVAWLEHTFLSTRAAESMADDSTDSHRDFLARGADRAARTLAHLVKQLLDVRRRLAPATAGAGRPPVQPEGEPAPRSSKRRNPGSRVGRPGEPS